MTSHTRVYRLAAGEAEQRKGVWLQRDKGRYRVRACDSPRLPRVASWDVCESTLAAADRRASTMRALLALNAYLL